MNAKSSPQKKQKQSSITVANKRSFKYVEPVRKKAERENLKGVECKQCRKFYDAVLPNADGKDADSSKQNFRCEHLDGVSRHRYRVTRQLSRLLLRSRCMSSARLTTDTRNFHRNLVVGDAQHGKTPKVPDVGRNLADEAVSGEVEDLE
ncbi:gamma response 1 [Spatholobus suberectus]|nr:gamma response 1 [Spatholobus suberectus]